MHYILLSIRFFFTGNRDKSQFFLLGDAFVYDDCFFLFFVKWDKVLVFSLLGREALVIRIEFNWVDLC